MKRIKYYVIHCSPEERDAGKDHWESFDLKKDAIKRAKEIPDTEFISVEKHFEVWTRFDWLPDWNMGDSRLEIIDYL